MFLLPDFGCTCGIEVVGTISTMAPEVFTKQYTETLGPAMFEYPTSKHRTFQSGQIGLC